MQQEGLTELRPGNYAYYDRTQVALGAATWEDCALTVLARVVSRPAHDRVILDSGSKTLTNDLARGFINTPGYGAVLRDIRVADPDTSLLIERLSEEHATVKVIHGETALKTGALVAHHPEPLVRGLEPGGPGLAGGRRSGARTAAGGGAWADHIESNLHGKRPARRSARPRGNPRPGRHD